MKNYTLSEFNALVKDTLKSGLEPSYWVVAEIAEINLHNSGHCYLTLVEKKDQRNLAKMRATIWSFHFTNLHKYFVSSTGGPLRQGMRILLNASLDFHEIYGMSLNIKDIDPNYTLGERRKAKHETIDQLVREGLIDLNKELQLPVVLQKIAVISSKTAAGYDDFTDQLNQNSYGYDIRVQLFQATLQGETAIESVAGQLNAIEEIQSQFDALVIIRGGGSQTDFDCFDNYKLCATIAKSSIPIITGIGHERDETVADMVANTKLKTPTAVAEFLLSTMISYESEMHMLFERIGRISLKRIALARLVLQEFSQRILLSAKHSIEHAFNDLNTIFSLVDKRPFQILQSEKKQIETMGKLLSSFDPKNVLDRGFSLTKVDGKHIKTNTSIPTHAVIETTYSGGSFKSKVLKKNHE